MKKIVLFSLLMTSFLYSDAKIYMGAGGGIYSETLDDTASTTISANMARVKVGYGVREAYAIEFSIDYVDNSEVLFAPNDGARYGLNVELIKAFDWGIYINPFVKAGFGMGYMETTVKDGEDSLSFGTFNLGAGTFIPISEHFDLELAYDYKYISYQKVQQLSDVDIQKSMSHTGYIGVNVRF